MSVLGVESGQRINVSSRLERLPSTSYHLFLTMILTVAWFIESIDLGGLSYILPVVGKHFHLDPKTMGLVASISFAGMFIGSIFSGSLADRFGRKKMLIAAMAWWGTAGALLSIAWSVQSLMVFRFLLGVGLGAQVPIGATILSEIVPAKERGKYLSLYQTFLPIGMSVAGLIAYLVLPKFGWQGVFLAEAIPALWLIVVWKYLPESARWLESKGRLTEADRLTKEFEDKVQQISGMPLPPVEVLAPSVPGKQAQKGLGQLLTMQFIPILIMAGIYQFNNMFSYYGMNMWLSTLLMAKGFSVTKSVAFVSLIALGGVPSYFLVKYMVDTVGRKWSAVFFVLAMAISAYIYGSATAVVWVIILGLIFQFFNYGMTSVNNVYIPELWPTEARGTGTGFAFGIGRIGAFVGPMVLGAVMGGYGPMAVFGVSSALLVVGGLLVAIMGPETKGKVF